MKRYLTLVATLCLLVGTALSQDIDRQTAQNLKKISSAIARYDKVELASLIALPYHRQYPLRSIYTASEMIDFLDSIFSPKIRAKLAQPANQRWEAVGWRGYMMAGGLIWSDGERIISMNITPIGEAAKLETARKADIAKLPADLQKGWRSHLMLRLGDNPYGYDRARIDMSTTYDGLCRLLLYKKGASMSTMPAANLHGELSVEGTLHSEVYLFHDKSQEISYMPDEAYKGTLTIQLRQNKRKVEIRAVEQ